MKHTTIAVDLAKSVFQVAISQRPGRVAEQHRLSRSRLLPFFAQQPPAVVVLETCGSAHHWARQLRGLGHTPVLLPAHDVHRYLQGNKTDQADTKTLLEAFRNEQIRPVPIKSLDQQALAARHRLRSASLATRTARLNTLRGILREFGLLIPIGARNVLPALRQLCSDTDSRLPQALRPALEQAPRWPGC
jgi:transposase